MEDYLSICLRSIRNCLVLRIKNFSVMLRKRLFTELLLPGSAPVVIKPIWSPGYKLFSCSAQLSIKFNLLINTKIQNTIQLLA